MCRGYLYILEIKRLLGLYFFFFQSVDCLLTFFMETFVDKYLILVRYLIFFLLKICTLGTDWQYPPRTPCCKDSLISFLKHCTGYHTARSWNVLSVSSDYASFCLFLPFISLPILKYTGQLFYIYRLPLNFGFSHDLDQDCGFSGKNIPQRWSALLTAYPECMLSAWLITGEDNLDLLIKVVSARVPCYQVRIFPFSYTVH